METKQLTAVEWLVEQILTEVQNYEDGDIENESEPFKHEYINKYIGMIDLSEFVIKAKEMEKEQIMKTAIQSYHKCILSLEKSGDEFIEYAKECYEETFESELETI